MKTFFNRNPRLASLFSAVATLIFIFLAVSSTDDPAKYVYAMGFSATEKVEAYDPISGTKTISTSYKNPGGPAVLAKTEQGCQEANGRWTGEVRTFYQDQRGNIVFEECANYEDGKRDGKSYIIDRQNADEGIVERTDEYIGGLHLSRVYGLKGKRINEQSAWEILNEEYPWFVYAVKSYGFSDEEFKNLADTIVLIMLDKEEYESYESVISNLHNDRAIEKILNQCSNTVESAQLANARNSPFRLAVVDYYRKPGRSIHDIVINDYRSYYQSHYTHNTAKKNFQKFCNELQDSLKSYPSVQPDDPFLADSVNLYLAKIVVNALFYGQDDGEIYMFKEEAKLVYMAVKDYSEYNSDPLMMATKKAWSLKKGLISMPTLGSKLGDNQSNKSVEIISHITWDGGSPVTSRGIVWTDSYEPTLDDNKIEVGKGMGEFKATINGTVKGKIYHARSYAINASGVVYSNDVEFEGTGEASGTEEALFVMNELKVYPNPARNNATVSFYINTPGKVALQVTDQTGREVLIRRNESFSEGVHEINIDLATLRSGMYICRLWTGKEVKENKFVVINGR